MKSASAVLILLVVVASASFGAPPPDVATITCPTGLIAGGAAGNATVTLTAVIPAGGETFDFSSDNPAVATVPATLDVGAGASNFMFAVTPLAAGTATIFANSPDATVSCTVTVAASPAVAGITCPTGLFAGGPAGLVTVTLTAPAPSGGLMATLDSSNPAVASVTATANVPAGATTFTFPVTPLTAGNADVGAQMGATARQDCSLVVAAAAIPASPAGAPTLGPAGLMLLALALVAGAGFAMRRG